MNQLEIVFGNALVIEHKGSATPSIRCFVTTKVGGVTVTGEGGMVYKLPDDKTIFVKVTYVDSRGNPAEVDGDVTWTTSDDTIANVGVKEGDSTEAQIIPGMKLGQAQITATADADVGEGVQELICTLDVEVVGGQAVGGTIEPVGPPQPFDPDAHPDQGLPPTSPGAPDQGLPGRGQRPPRPDQGLPGQRPVRPEHPDQGLPGQGRPPRPDNSLPGSGNRPGNELPDSPAPKRR